MPPAAGASALLIALRSIMALAIAVLTLVFRFAPRTRLSDGTRWTLLAIVAGLALAWVLGELLKLGLERLVGFRYLLIRRRNRWGSILLGAFLSLMVVGFVLFGIARHYEITRHYQLRGIQTIGVIVILWSAHNAIWTFLLRSFSVFTTVSTMGVVYGVSALIVVFGVTSGFEREFQDKVLALNAHLIVQAYGDADFQEMDEIQRRLKDMPGVVRMAPFLFSAGEVMIGRVGANLKGIDLQTGADDLRAALKNGVGTVEDLARPASCPVPATDPPKTTSDVGRIAIGAELARKLRVGRGDCISIMVPFSSGAADAPVSYLFKVTGIFRMGFNEYDTRLAYVSIADAQRLASVRRLVSGVELRFSDPMMALSASTDIQNRLGSPHHLVDWKELNGNLFRALLIQKVFIALILVIIVVVAAFNIVASLTMIVLTKVREIAILQSMGAPSSMVARIFWIGGTSVGLIGTGLGIGFGLLFCLLARLYGYPLDPHVYLIGQLPVLIRPEEIVGVAAATIGISWLATLYPALRASRLTPVEGLRYT